MQPHGKKYDSYIGYPTVQSTPVSKDFCQESLTKLPKKILNRDTYSIFRLMGFNKIGTGLAAAALSLSGCANAQETAAAARQTPDAVELTLADCAARTTEAAIDACLIAFDEQEHVKIASARDAIATLDATIEGQEETIRSIRAETAEARTTNEVLRNEINQIFIEESELGD